MDTNKLNPPADDSSAGPAPARRTDPGISSARRRLVKGGMLIPPIMVTLRSGAAIAQTSVTSCLGANQSAAEDATALATAKDEWMRSPVIIKEARRVRRQNGQWVFKGSATARVYTHASGNRGTWISLKPGLAGRRFRLVDSGRDIQIVDPSTGAVVLTGSLLRRKGNPLRRYVSIVEEDALWLLQFDQNGDLIVDEEGDPVISETTLSAAEANALTTSCWASLHPGAEL